MFRQPLLVLVLLASFQCSVSEDVTIDVPKLTKFTTSFTLKMRSLRKSAEITGHRVPRDIDNFFTRKSNVTVHGKLIADIPGEKMKIRLDTDGVTFAAAPLPTVHPNGTVVLTFDGPSGYVSMEANGFVEDLKGTRGKLESKGCLKVKFNPHMIPPPASVKQIIRERAPQVAMFANQMPHVVDDGFVYYQSKLSDMEWPHVSILSLRAADGTPAAVWLVDYPERGYVFDPHRHVWLKQPLPPLDSRRLNLVKGIPPFLEFSEFTAPEPFSEVQCVGTPGLMLDRPLVQQALFLSEQLLAHLQLATPLSPLTEHMFSQLPHVLRYPNDEKACMLPKEAASKTTQVEPLDPFGFAAVGVVAAAVGAGIVVIGARRAFSKAEVGYVAIS